MRLMFRGLFVLGVILVAATARTTATQQTRYSAKLEDGIVHLEDAVTHTVVSLIPSAGNITYEMLVNGKNALSFSGGPLDQFKARGGVLTGIPFLAPFANRLDEDAFYANGKKYAFDMGLGNIRGAIPIHGFLTTTKDWQVVEVKADDNSAWVTSRLDFYKHPDWMKQWPFAHTIEMTHRLQNGALEVTTKLTNLSVDPMPVAIGFHPFYQLTDSTRDDWTISIGAKTHYLLASTKVPTGETEPITKMFPDPNNIPLKNYDLDDVYGDLVRDSSGRAEMILKGPGTQQVHVMLGEHYKSVVVWAPTAGYMQNRNFVCFEPMSGITDALNLAQKGLYKELQSVPPNGGTWEASFWVKPIGF